MFDLWALCSLIFCSRGLTKFKDLIIYMLPADRLLLLIIIGADNIGLLIREEKDLDQISHSRAPGDPKKVPYIAAEDRDPISDDLCAFSDISGVPQSYIHCILFFVIRLGVKMDIQDFTGLHPDDPGHDL